MIYSLRGNLILKGLDFFIIEVSGIGFRVFSSQNDASKLPPIGEEISVFCRAYVKEDEIDLYGFLDLRELQVFELLNSVNGVGPKSALAVINVAKLDELLSAIKENRPDVLSRASGIGKKTAERITLELRDKVQASESAETVKKMEGDSDIVEVLVGLGYNKDQVKRALSTVAREITSLEERLKLALKILSNKKN
ncbi:MAG: Holliday junction branch migration protein RuvA [bacterium]|nr:Holliday junction branch migration protein RuvA [bacterium]